MMDDAEIVDAVLAQQPYVGARVITTFKGCHGTVNGRSEALGDGDVWLVLLDVALGHSGELRGGEAGAPLPEYRNRYWYIRASQYGGMPPDRDDGWIFE